MPYLFTSTFLRAFALSATTVHIKRIVRVAIFSLLFLLTSAYASVTQSMNFAPAALTTEFQPQAPYYATFFYLWYQNPNTNDRWSYWQDRGTPPRTWFSNYLPDPYPDRFSPSLELYSSTNYNIFRWQARQLAEARLEVAIASWWGAGRKEDAAFNTIINDFMGRSNNPYPNLRWTIYYEIESVSDPSVDRIVQDLTYLSNRYTDSPYYFKIDGKPVVFVYGGSNDTPGSMTRRWRRANAALGNRFYINLKLFSGYEDDPNQPDSWHQYSPARRSGRHGRYSFFVSPGFWMDGDRVQLPRNPVAFETAVRQMVAANTTWKLVETWNEWGEGTAVEPGEQVRYNAATRRDEPDPNGVRFNNIYVRILRRNLPPLEQGTG